MRVADYIVYFLEKIGVRNVFLVSGGGMMHLLDAVSRSEKIKYICNHHEQACAMAAEGYAKKTGQLGVCYATSGPGATNIITGLVGAWQDSSPLLCITGQSKLCQTIRNNDMFGLRQFGTFEVDIISMVDSVTKYHVFLDDPQMIRYHLEKAYALATKGRPGPVLIDIPVDIQGAIVDPDALVGYMDDELSFPELDTEVLVSVLDRLKTAKRPLILAGHGVRVSGQSDLFNQVLENLNIPVVTTQLAKDLIEYTHPLFVGHPGMKGDRAGNFAVQNADVIVVLGCSLHVLTTGYELDKFAPNAYKIQIELDEKVLTREMVNVDEKIQCDIGEFLNKIKNYLQKNSWLYAENEWHNRCIEWKYHFAVQNEPHQDVIGSINYYRFIDSLSRLCPEKATIVTDAGSAFYVVGHAFRAKKGQRVIVSGSLGAMGYALPASTGASVAVPQDLVVCVTGDGSLQTNIHELAVIVHNHLNVKIFVLNNSGYISIQNTQTNFFQGHTAGVGTDTGIFFPDLKKLSDAYNSKYMTTSSLENLSDTIQQTLDYSGPVLCEIFADKKQDVIPTVSSKKMPDGKMVSKPLDDMYPFMDDTIRKQYLTFNDNEQQTI